MLEADVVALEAMLCRLWESELAVAVKLLEEEAGADDDALDEGSVEMRRRSPLTA